MPLGKEMSIVCLMLVILDALMLHMGRKKEKIVAMQVKILLINPEGTISSADKNQCPEGRDAVGMDICGVDPIHAGNMDFTRQLKPGQMRF